MLSIAGLLAAAQIAAAPVSREVEAPGPAGPLKGTLVEAADRRSPVVLIIPGSGPTDRDGNNPLGIRAASYRLLAEALAAQGVASVRIDKRGMFGSRAAVPDANAVTLDDYAGDTRAWIDAVRRDRGTRCVWLAGHSEGGVVALATARRSAEGICGLVLLATPGRPLGDALKAQLRANPANAPLLADAERTIDTLAAGGRVDVTGLHPALAALFAPPVQGFLNSILSVDPAELLAGVDRPVLILQGRRDLQVLVVDAERLAAARPAAKLVLLNDVNHVLKSVATDDRAANAATYADSALPLAPGVAEAIAAFVRPR